MKNTNYILLTYQTLRDSIRPFYMDEYPSDLISKLNEQDLEENLTKEGANCTGWALYKKESNYYTLVDGESANNNIESTLSNYIDANVNKFFRSNESEIQNLYELWTVYLNGKGKDVLISYATNILLQANSDKIYKVTTTTKGRIILDENSFQSGDIYDIGKTDSELFASVAIIMKGTIEASKEELEFEYLFTIYQPLIESQTNQNITDINNWHADIHNLELVELK